MPLAKLQIRYQTARSLPAPYAYFYTLTAQPVRAGSSADDTLQIDFAITYPDREDIDDDELIAEGYTRDDDFSWSGRLPQTWLRTISDLVNKTKLSPLDEDKLGEEDEFWAMHIETTDQSPRTGAPKNDEDWQYLMQELIQATYESIGRERPFELTYLDLSRHNDLELRLTASFAQRTVKIQSNHNRQEPVKTLPWTVLQRVMSEVYAHDYDPDSAELKRPKQEGKWLNMGGEEWYDIRSLTQLTKILNEL